MTKVDLDDVASYPRHDPGNMWSRVNDLAVQIEDAWAIVQDVALPESYRTVRNVLIAGMGGSAIGGSLVEGYAADVAVPVTVWRNYGLPGYVGPETLVIAVSYSGNTEETLSAVQAARQRGARLLAVTTGGTLGRLADQWGFPAVRFTYEAQPRAALGYLFTPLLGIFARLGFIPDQESDVRAAIDAAIGGCRQWKGKVPAADNPAKQLAFTCLGRAVSIYGAGYLAPVARRWKTQLNENAKTWASWEEFPELNHNAIVGYEYPPRLRDDVQVIVLRGRFLPERILTRMTVTDSLLDEYGISHTSVDGQGTVKLAEMVSLIALGDYVSYYLALLNEVDPTTIAPINRLKSELARV
jgi:glucose/mannose-6-phosphate isomerase